MCPDIVVQVFLVYLQEVGSDRAVINGIVPTADSVMVSLELSQFPLVVLLSPSIQSQLTTTAS
jgi:hypothetical protein